jgi:hypothetical protein
MNPILEAYPELRGWRGSLVGLMALAAEVLGFALIKLFEVGLWRRVTQHPPEHFGYRLFMTCCALFLLSVPLGVAGLSMDRKKEASMFVLVTFLPALIFLVLWSGYW